MNPVKWFIRTAFATVVFLVTWASEDEEDDEEEEFDVGTMERDAAYLTTGLITAVRAINAAHEEGGNCLPHHEALNDLLTTIEHPLTAIRVIQHLLEITAAAVDDNDVQEMVATIVATELGHGEEEEDDNPFDH